jgi:hypothetical protein
MIPTPRHVSTGLLLASFSTLALAGAETPDPRPNLQAAQAALDQALAEVSLPSVHFLLGGHEAARGYRVKGVGVFFVLPPRALPIPHPGRVLVLDRRAPRAVVHRLSKDQERELRAMQAQVDAMQKDAEAMQREAERALETLERNLRVRLVAPSPAAAPAPPEAPEPGEPPEPPMSADAPEALPPPPWRSWFDTSEPTDERTPEKVITDVQNALTAALEDIVPSLPSIPADEQVLLAVDFLPMRGFDLDGPSGPVRSLILKVKKRDLNDRHAGKITPEELRRRIEYTQY